MSSVCLDLLANKSICDHAEFSCLMSPPVVRGGEQGFSAGTGGIGATLRAHRSQQQTGQTQRLHGPGHYGH